MLQLVVWMVLSVVGTLVASVDAWDAWRDLSVSYRASEAHRFVARRNLRRQVLRAAVLALFLAIGVIAAVVDDPGGVVGWMLVAGAALVTADAVLDRIDRFRLHTYIDNNGNGG